MTRSTIVILASLVVAAVAVAAGAGSAAADDTVPYVVQTGDTCTSIANTQLGDEKRIDVLHVLNPQLGPKQPHVLIKGQVLRLPKPSPDAEVTQTHGDVTARGPAQSSWHDAKIDEDLFRAWRVSSGDSSAAEIKFAKAAVFGLRENTIVVIFGPAGADAKIDQRQRQAVLESGTLRVRLGELAGHTVVVTTPSSETQLTEGNALVTAEGDGTTLVANHGGAPAVVRSRRAPRSKPVEVADNFGSKVLPDAVPSPPRPLPPSPLWVTGAPTTFAAPDGATTDLIVAWQAVPQAERYRIDVTSDAEAHDVVQQLVVDKAITRFEAKSVPLGTMFLTVAAIDAEHFESKPSVRIPVTVIAMTVSPPFGPAGTKLDSPVVGSKLAAPVSGGCTTKTAPMASGIIARTTGELILHCVDGSGAVVAPIIVNVAPFPVSIATHGVLVRGRSGIISLGADAAIIDRVKLVAPPGITLGVVQSTARDRREIAVTGLPTAHDAHVTLAAMLDVDGESIEVGRVGLDVVEPPAIAWRRWWFGDFNPARGRWSIGVFNTARRDGYGAGLRIGFGVHRFVEIQAEANVLSTETTRVRFGSDLTFDPLSRLRLRPFVGVGVVLDTGTTDLEPRGRLGLRFDASSRLGAELDVVRATQDPYELRLGFAYRL